jgi:uncharacterized membrane protein YGL010W
MATPRWRDWHSLAQDYAQYHRNPANKVCHAIGIPLIVFCVVRWSQIPGTALPVAALVLPVYFIWNAGLGLAMAVVLALMAAAANILPSWPFLPLFIGGWALQFLGHRFEGRSPAFTENAWHLLVGPLWILREMGARFSLR